MRVPEKSFTPEAACPLDGVHAVDMSRLVSGIPRLSGTPGHLRLPAPELGEHTAEMLAGLGLDRAQIEGLARDGIVRLGGGEV